MEEFCFLLCMHVQAPVHSFTSAPASKSVSPESRPASSICHRGSSWSLHILFPGPFFLKMHTSHCSSQDSCDQGAHCHGHLVHHLGLVHVAFCIGRQFVQQFVPCHFGFSFDKWFLQLPLSQSLPQSSTESVPFSLCHKWDRFPIKLVDVSKRDVVYVVKTPNGDTRVQRCVYCFVHLNTLQYTCTQNGTHALVCVLCYLP